MSRKPKRATKSKKGRHKTAEAAATSAAADPSKRDSLRLLRNGGLAVLALGAAGWAGTRAVRANIYTHDLGRVGQGTPMVVQIHDPSCQTCNTLKRRTPRALRGIDDARLQYVIADIKTQEGAAYAAAHGVPHVTLLLGDGKGAAQSVLQGLQDVDVLRAAFEAHAAPTN